MVFADPRDEFLLRKTGRNLSLNPMLGKDLEGPGAQLVSDQNLKHASTFRFSPRGRRRADQERSARSVSHAHSIHGSNASISEVSTVAPPQIRKPGGASR